jgi:hypothetical protein
LSLLLNLIGDFDFGSYFDFSLGFYFEPYFGSGCFVVGCCLDFGCFGSDFDFDCDWGFYSDFDFDFGFGFDFDFDFGFDFDFDLGSSLDICCDLFDLCGFSSIFRPIHYIQNYLEGLTEDFLRLFLGGDRLRLRLLSRSF